MSEHDAKTVQDVATEWFVRMRDEGVSAADQAAFRTWFEADPAHRQAYQELERVWTGLDHVRPGVPETVNVTALDVQASSTPNAGAANTGSQSTDDWKRTVYRPAIAASMAAVIVLCGYLISLPGLFADYRTAAGEQREISLDDGSRIRLNTASTVSVNMTDGARHIILHAGEAFFEVSSDPDRPFTVDAGDGQIKVLGTAFSVRRQPAGTRVVVTENRVEVTGPLGKSEALVAGEAVHAASTGLGPVAQANLKRDLAWIEQELVFENTPLDQVLSEIDRYHPGRILVMSSGIEQIPVTGIFSIADSNRALDTVEESLPVRFVRLSGFIVLAFVQDGDPS